MEWTNSFFSQLQAQEEEEPLSHRLQMVSEPVYIFLSLRLSGPRVHKATSFSKFMPPFVVFEPAFWSGNAGVVSESCTAETARTRHEAHTPATAAS